MSLAPASSRGVLLEGPVGGERHPVRSEVVGHVDGGGAWALVQHGGLFEVLGRDAVAAQAISFGARRERHGPHYFRSIGRFSGRLAVPWGAYRFWPHSEIGGADPEHLALGILGVEPEQRQLREGGLQLLAAPADLAQQPALGRQVPPASSRMRRTRSSPSAPPSKASFGSARHSRGRSAMPSAST